MHFDLHQIPIEDNSFDVIFAITLEHVEDDIRCMSELFRVMKPGGWGIFQIPIDWKRTETYEDKTITSLKKGKSIFGKKIMFVCMD